jgi:transposase
VLSVEDWAEIRRLHRAERMPIKVIARVVGCSKNTVKSALAADQPPTYRRQPRGSVVDAVELRIRELLQACPMNRPGFSGGGFLPSEGFQTVLL